MIWYYKIWYDLIWFDEVFSKVGEKKNEKHSDEEQSKRSSVLTV